MKYTTEYNSTKYFVGAEFDTKNYGKIRIISKKFRKGKDPLYSFIFLSTGNVSRAEGSNINKGMLKDLLSPTAFNKGYLGIGKHKSGSRGRPNKQWTLWYNMLGRCYGDNPKHTSYHDVTVTDRWLNFQHFCDDLPYIKGYDNWLKGGYSIDKDKSGKRLYSLDTVEFILNSDNSIERQERLGTCITERDSKGRIVSSNII